MTILHVWTSGVDPEEKILIERNYQDDTTTVTVDYYGTSQAITLPTPDLRELLRSTGLGGDG